ncbi:ribonuclease HII [Seonamhaeicola sediminis]|uniref:Ribonuclease HII n=1 Tax=Seonamhaeicola sediminis TaxID=2528206 RepID=A0A562YBD7_9FLAO|nr:ribonuclease HII [Seonamhaeicola sediminis]TWO31605.1 ribonuclease HII [Seonamhaeicola sediminis]
MKPCLLTLLFSLILFSCSNPKTKRTELIDFAPENASVIVTTSNFESFKNTITNNDFLKRLSKSSNYQKLEHILENTSLIKPLDNILICFSKDTKDSLQFTVITKYYSELLKTDSLKNYSEESLNYKNQTVLKSTLNNQPFYSTIIDSTFFASSSKDILDNVFNKSEINTDLKKAYSTFNKNKTCSVIIKSNSPFINNITNQKSLKLNNFTEYIAFDVEANQNEIILNGITKATDSLRNVIDLFKNTIPQENKTQYITPSNSDGFISFTFDNFKTLASNLLPFNKKDSTYISPSLFNDIIEIGIIYQDREQAIVLNSIDNIATKDALTGNENIMSSYREVDIFNFDDPLIFSKTFTPLVSFNNANLYCVIDSFFVFADSIELLQSIIANYQNKTTLSERYYFKNIKEHLSDESSMLCVYNPSYLNKIINENLEDDLDFKLDKYHTSALQFIYDHNFAHVNGVIKKSKSNAVSNSISEEFSIKLDTDILNQPQFVTNHITKQKEIVVQDINNNLYLISNQGKIIWKKKLQGPVLGNINQIDIYKNGRLQLCFATSNRLYVIDRNGKDVAPFPGKFNDKITQPLSVFDYDKKKNYRLLVTQGKNLLMYDVRAKLVNGFVFKSANDYIISQPKHFRIGSKDYLTFKTKNKLYILDRTGRSRVTPRTNGNFSSQSVFLYNNQFTTTTADGNLYSVKTNGDVSLKNIGLTENHYLTTTSKTLVALNENKLTIKTKTSELDFGDYTEPLIFYINDKIYVTVTDKQSHKVYLFDSLSKMIPNFPVYGNSLIALDNIDQDQNLEFVTKGENNSVILYQIN